MEAKLLAQISAAIRYATHRPFEVHNSIPIAGGCINQAYRLEGPDGSCYFLKLNDAQHLPMFVAEAEGLNVITTTNTIRVPCPITHGIAGGQSYLVLEHLELNSRGDEKRLGTQLAALHRCSAQQFGFAQNNFIGTTTQLNDRSSDWITFWREQRLGFQLDLATCNGYGGKLQEMGYRLMERLPEFFDGYHPQPSLLHGDLWGGNHAYIADGAPVIFDPAPYYGDREADLAMTELFGGFGPEFYAAYHAAWPLDVGYATRKTVYNLYHILNHANLFGGEYARQAEAMLQRLLTENKG